MRLLERRIVLYGLLEVVARIIKLSLFPVTFCEFISRVRI